MRRRALLIGSRTGKLAGTANDLRIMHASLTAHGFESTVVQERQATYRGIRRAYLDLIEQTAAGDAALVYFTGHGARLRNPGPGPAWLRYLVPTDPALIDGDEFTGLLAEEMSLLQARLTARTANVTIILDCCYAARMSRNPALVPKAITRSPGAARAVLEAQRRRLRDDARAAGVTGDSNPSAVRLVACGSDEVAYELPAAHGGPHGALTAAFAEVLGRPGSGELSWQELIALIRPAVSDLVPGQRPEVEGPAGRRLFELTEKRRTGVLTVGTGSRGVHLPYPGLFGVARGDRYALVPAGGDPERPATAGTVTAVHGDHAPLRLDRELPPELLRAPLEAHPVMVSLGRRAVVVVPADHPDRGRAEASLFGRAHLRPAGPGERPLATIHLHESGATLLDAGGEPLHPGPAGLPAVLDWLTSLARASHLRELQSGTGAEALDDDVDAEFVLLHDDGPRPVEVHGGHLFAGDEVVLRLHNQGAGRRHVSVFDIGLRGAVTLLSTSEPSGLTIGPGETYELNRTAAGDLEGIRLFWPAALPRGGPRPESLLMIVTDRPQDLRALTQHEAVPRGTVRSSLQARLDELSAGLRSRAPGHGPAVRYRVRRFDFLLHPRHRPPDEPAFAIDERPDLSLRLTPSAVRGRRLSAYLGDVDGTLRALTVSAEGDRVRLRWSTVEDGRSAEIFAGHPDGAVEVAVWRSGTPVEVACAARGPLVDATAEVIRAVTVAVPGAERLLRATLLPAEAPRTIVTRVGVIRTAG